MIKSKKNRAFSLIELSIVILVIGILIAGITQGSRLYDKFRLQTAQNLTMNSPVNGIPDLVLWYETILDSSFTSSQNADLPISVWNDISGQRPIKNNATQNTPANQPIFRENDQNGIPAIEFDGTSDFMSFSGSEFINSDYTIFVVAKKTLKPTWNFVIAGDSCGLNQNLVVGYVDGANNSNSAWQSHCANDIGRSLPTYSVPQANILTAWFSQDFGKRLRVNGAGPSADNVILDPNKKNPVSSSINTLRIGRFIGSNFYRGKVFEIIMYSRALTNEERLAVEKYLGQKFAIKMTIS